MKYQLAEKHIEGIKSFAVSNENKLLISTNNKVIDLQSKKILIESEISFQELYHKNSKFFINNLYGKGYLFNNDFEVTFLDKYIFTINNNFVITSKKIEEERITIITNLENEDEIYKIKGSSTKYFIGTQKMFRNNFEENVIECFSFPKGDVVWQFSMSLLGNFKSDATDNQNYEVIQFIGTYKNILWVYINSKEFVGLDIHSGKLKYRISGVKKNNLLGRVDSYSDNDDYYIFYDTEYILNEGTGKIIGLKGDRYFEIDIVGEEPTTKLYGLWEEMENFGINKNDVSSKNILNDSYLYFYTYNQLKFGILNIESKKIVFVSEIIGTTMSENGKNQIKDMQVINDKVYVLDSGGILNIFESE